MRLRFDWMVLFLHSASLLCRFWRAKMLVAHGAITGWRKTGRAYSDDSLAPSDPG